jgi:Mg2+ and Co2+ transporter CorA
MMSNIIKQIMAHSTSDFTGMTLTDDEVDALATNLKDIEAERDALQARLELSHDALLIAYLSGASESKDAYIAGAAKDAAARIAELEKALAEAETIAAWNTRTPNTSYAQVKLAAYKRDRQFRLVIMAMLIAGMGLVTMALAVTVTKAMSNTVALSLADQACIVGGC